MCKSAARRVATCFAGSSSLPMINVAVCETNVSLSQNFSNYFDKYVVKAIFQSAAHNDPNI